jgi:hypothetical protein
MLEEKHGRDQSLGCFKCIIFLAVAVLLVGSSGCAKQGRKYLDRRPAPAELAGNWHSRDNVPGGNGKEMIIVLRADKLCEIAEIPIYDMSTRTYKTFTGSGRWIFNSSFLTKQGARVIVGPDSSNLSAALEIMEDSGQIVLQYSTDPESSQAAYFTRKN